MAGLAERIVGKKRKLYRKKSKASRGKKPMEAYGMPYMQKDKP